jgi:hypothetical protein
MDGTFSGGAITSCGLQYSEPMERGGALLSGDAECILARKIDQRAWLRTA